mmetsp:Transcript_58459/g.71486  ORF Transcript_58459/g.71486 Transcript_58459/m.71486 type:complete len:121 (+) Transcript_58459:99-461(+)
MSSKNDEPILDKRMSRPFSMNEMDSKKPSKRNKKSWKVTAITSLSAAIIMFKVYKSFTTNNAVINTNVGNKQRINNDNDYDYYDLIRCSTTNFISNNSHSIANNDREQILVDSIFACICN